MERISSSGNYGFFKNSISCFFLKSQNQRAESLWEFCCQILHALTHALNTRPDHLANQVARNRPQPPQSRPADSIKRLIELNLSGNAYSLSIV
jgi:hypothetical protein